MKSKRSNVLIIFCLFFAFCSSPRFPVDTGLGVSYVKNRHVKQLLSDGTFYFNSMRGRIANFKELLLDSLRFEVIRSSDSINYECITINNNISLQLFRTENEQLFPANFSESALKAYHTAYIKINTKKISIDSLVFSDDSGILVNLYLRKVYSFKLNNDLYTLLYLDNILPCSITTPVMPFVIRERDGEYQVRYFIDMPYWVSTSIYAWGDINQNGHLDLIFFENDSDKQIVRVCEWHDTGVKVLEEYYAKVEKKEIPGCFTIIESSFQWKNATLP